MWEHSRHCWRHSSLHMDEVMAELAQMTGAINTTSLSINSLQKGLTCCKRHILHGNSHIPLCDSFIYTCFMSASQIIQPLLRQNKCFGKVSPACREPASPSSERAKPRARSLCVLYNAPEENALEQHSAECEKHWRVLPWPLFTVKWQPGAPAQLGPRGLSLSAPFCLVSMGFFHL